MSVSGIGSSHALEWLQGYLSKAGSAAGSQPAAMSHPSNDRASISREAKLLNGQGSQAADPLQVSGVKGVQGRHHRQCGSAFGDQLAHSIMAELTGAAGGGAASRTAEATAQAGANGGSLIDQLASQLVKNVQTKYQPVSGFSETALRSNLGLQVDRTA